MTPHILEVQEPGHVGIRSFFEHLCPLLLRERAELCGELGGKFAFRITGEGGGEWLLDLERQQVAARRGDADLTIQMDADDFDDLLAGKLDAAMAIDSGQLLFRGEQRLFDHLAQFLAPLT